MANKGGEPAETAAQISQSVNGNQSPNIIAGGNVSVTYVNEEKLSQRKAIEEEKQDASQQESGGQVQSGESAAEASEQGGIKETEEAPLTEGEFWCLGIFLFIGGCFGFQCADGFFQSVFFILIGGAGGGATFFLYDEFFEDLLYRKL
ncbi:MAG: hypothetical protein Q3M24_04435 [Candidatus Electrothrix aestuarii]|uniref:TM2 domain-containing protein n=1 Tax=Candidatus Electrothrix aestuarii TaxID=3062594 RepID=A0AAU8LYR1_9BACT